MEPKDELLAVRDQLEMIEIQIQDLLDQQQQLRERQEYLEKLITHTAITGTTTAHADTQDWSKSDFKWSAKLNEIKSSVFGIKKFRPLQEQTMNATMGGKDCILIMPTGGGKSLCFQLTALASPGVTLVVSPLVSLMEDQLMALHKHDIQAEMLNASSSKEKVKAVHDAMTTKGNPLKLLYVTPEKLAKSKRFMNKLEKMYDAGRFSRLAIDEVHCCSQWGHDFRPDYKFLGVMRRQFPGVPILGLTATATTNVLEDVKKILGIQDCIIFRASFNRPNLFYEVRAKPTSIQNFLDDAQKLIETRFRGNSGIIYCLTQKDSEEVARGLQSRGIKACCYHANLDCKYRSQVHTRWTNNQLQVVVATIAFGMGIDKPDVRFVIHHSISKSMENYYQESGRAGRDDKRSYCILYYHLNDMFRQSTMVMTEQTGVEKLYGMIDYAISHSKCRRTLIARYFGETWDSTQCNKMCDSCDDSTGQGTVTKSVNTYCNDIIALLEHASKTKTRMTALKLVDAWLGKGSPALRLSHVKTPQLPREDCERLIALMLLQGYLKEDFHFTPYSTISYLVKGPKARLLSSGKEVTMDIKVTRKTAPTSSAASNTEKGKNKVTKKSDKSSTSKEKDKKVKPCFINKEKSMFTQHSESHRTDLGRQRTESPTFPSVKKSTGSTSTDSAGTIGSPVSESISKSADKRKSENSSTKVKRRKIMIESDSEDGFDFSDMWSGEPSTSMSKTDSKRSSGNCVVLSDDSDVG